MSGPASDPRARFVTRIRPLLLLAALLAVTAGASATAPPARTGPWRVAILMGADPALPAMQQHDRALREGLRAAAPAGVTFFTDTIDTYRFDWREFSAEFLALQRRKYAGQQVDLVIGVGEPAIAATRAQRDALWPDVPIVFSGIDEATVDRSLLPPDAATVSWRLDIDGTLALVAALQPQARQLVVLGGSADFDVELTGRVASRARALGGWQTQAWTTLSLEEMLARLPALGPDTAVVYTTMTRDANGRTAFPAEALARLADASGAPIYALFASYAGHGAAAGSVIDFGRVGRRAAELGAAVLRGTPAGSADATPMTDSRCFADHPRLLRYGLSPQALPAGCEVRGAPRNLWTEYRGFVIAAGVVVAAQALTIGGLLVQRRRRRQAEADATQRGIELARAMRFAAMGELTASIAHEISQPLGAILSNADAATLLVRRGDATPQALQEILADIRRDDLRATEVIRRLRALLGKHEVEHVPMAMHPVLREVLALLEAEARQRGVVVETALDAADDALLGDPVQLQQVLMNLVINAMDAMETTPSGRRRLTVTTADDGDAIVLGVADRGAGVAPGDHEAVFRSFHTTKPRGMGLGLPIVRAIVDAHQGRVGLAAREGGGTIATVRLPRRVAATGPAAADPSRRTDPLTDPA